MEYVRTELQRMIEIQNVITMYYFEKGKDFVFAGERHDFWEFLYIDRGEVEVHTDDASFMLTSGMIVFHKPNEFHSFTANRKALNLIVMTFDCLSPAIREFEGKAMQLNDEERNLLAQMIKEGRDAFIYPFRHPLERREDAQPGSEQLIKLYLETFLLRLLRRLRQPDRTRPMPLSYATKERQDDDIAAAVAELLESRLDGKVTLDEISGALHVSKTRLKGLFKRKYGCTIIEYFMERKVEKAKLMIREESYNFTEIASQLGFSSVHYFSKTFKKTVRMSPSEYAKSVQARS